MLKTLTDSQLLTQIKAYVREEKKWTFKVLEHLQEIECRKVYADLGLHSLFGYCVKILKYSEAEATVRVNSIRLFKKIPAAKSKIASNKLSLTNSASLNKFLNQNPLNPKEQINLLEEVCDKSTREVEKILNDKSEYKIKSKKIILNERFLKKLEKIQNDFDSCSELEALEALMDGYLEKKEQEKPMRNSNIKSKNQRYITRKVKEAVNARAKGQCEYVGATGKRCHCRINLQQDHIKPIAYGGSSNVENLRILCFAHNQRAWICDARKLQSNLT